MLKLDARKPAVSVLWPGTKAVSRRILSNTSTALFRDGHLFSAKRDTYPNLITWGQTQNSGVLSVMAVELLGVNALPHVLVVTAIAFLVAGHRGIYAAQRVVRTKYGTRVHPPKAVRDFRGP